MSSFPTLDTVSALGDGTLWRRGSVWTYTDAPLDPSGSNLRLPTISVPDSVVQTAIASGEWGVYVTDQPLEGTRVLAGASAIAIKALSAGAIVPLPRSAIGSRRLFRLVTGGTIPTLGPTTASFTAGVAAGTVIANITGVPAGVTPTYTAAVGGDAGKIVVGGSEGAGWKLVVGMVSAVAGTLSGTIAATGATSATIAVTVGALSALGPNAATFIAGATSGTLANITGLQPSEAATSIVVTSTGLDDGKLAIANAGARIVVGLTASSAGTINYTVSTNQGRSFAFAVTAQAAVAAGPFTNPLIATLGGSRQRQSGLGISSGVAAYEITAGYASWLKAIEPRIRFGAWADNTTEQNSTYMNGMLFAIDGGDLPSMDRRLEKLCASDANIVLVDTPSNSIQFQNPDGSTFSVAVYTAELKRQLLIIAAAGKLPCVTSLFERAASVGGPWANSNPPTDVRPRRLVPAINAEMQSWCADRGFPWVDIRSVLIDLSDSNNLDPAPLPDMIRDGTHYSTRGAYAAAKLIKVALQPFITGTTASDVSIAANLISNPTFTGSGGTTTGAGISGPVPDGHLVLRESGTGTTALSTVTITKVTENGLPALKFTIDTTGMANLTDKEGIQYRFTPFPGLTINNWYQGSVRTKSSAFDAWYAGGSMLIGDSSGKQTIGLGVTDYGGGAVTNIATSIPLAWPTEAYTSRIETFPMKAGATGNATLGVIQIWWKKGTASQIAEFTIYDPKFVQVGDPRLWMYNEADTTPATITSAATASFQEEVALSFQATADKLVKWSLTGADAALFSINVHGAVTMLTIPDFEKPISAAGTNAYSFNIVAQPFNPNVAATVQAVTFNITDINDGFTDPMAQATYAANTPLETNNNWTQIAGDAGSIQYRGLTSGGVKATGSAGGGQYLAPQQGNTVEQQITVQYGSSSNNSHGYYPLYLDGNNHFRADFYATSGGIPVKRVIAGASATQVTFTPYLNDLTNSKITYQIINIGGVYTLECYQNGVKLNAASGSVDVTAYVAGAGALVNARRSLLRANNVAFNPLIYSWNNRVAAPIASKLALYPLTLSANTGPASVPFEPSIVGFLQGAERNVTATPTVPAGFTGSIVADGIVLRVNGGIAGSYTVTITETDPRVVNNNRTSNVSFTLT